MFRGIIYILSYTYFKWPRLTEVCTKKIDEEVSDFKKLVEIRLKCKTQLWHYLAQMNRKWYDVFDNILRYSHICEYLAVQNSFEDKGNLYVEEKDLDLLIRQNNEGHHMNYYFIMDELTAIVEESER